MAEPAFTGYGPGFRKFLKELEKNNEREWFNKNKKRYEEHVLEPTRALIRALGPKLAKISPQIVASDKKQGGSMMRIYRDVRFSKDKRPYNTNVSIQFRHAAGKGISAPGFYLRMTADDVMIGTGIYHPDTPTVARIREHLDKNQKAWLKVRDAKAMQRAFGEGLGGESLKRPPRGYDPDHPLVEDLKRKDFAAFGEVDRKLMASKTFPTELAKRYRTSAAFMKFLCDAVGQPF